jgi:prepilin-type N-terminal cleavage/methylation domain-containing protein
VIRISDYRLAFRNFRKTREGFTLIELLIVIAVIGGLASIVVTSFPAALKRARDANRRSDIKQYQTAMEVYYNKNNAYAVKTGNPADSTFCNTTLGLASCPTDPTSTQTYNINASATNYAIWGQLEQPKAATGYFIVCSDGRSGECETAPSSSSCAAGCP